MKETPRRTKQYTGTLPLLEAGRKWNYARSRVRLGRSVGWWCFLNLCGGDYGEAVKQHPPFRLTSPNAIDPVPTVTAFLLSVQAGARPFAHTSLLRPDVALHELLGSLASRMMTPFTTCSNASGKDSASVFSPACGTSRWSGCRNILADTAWI